MSTPGSPRTDAAHEQNQSLWLLAAAPLIWAAHFLICYTSAAIFCARYAGPDGSLARVRIAIAIFTGAALLGIGITAGIAWKRYAYQGVTAPVHTDTAASRHRFLGLAGLLLAALSAVATLYASLAAVFFRSCA